MNDRQAQDLVQSIHDSILVVPLRKGRRKSKTFSVLLDRVPNMTVVVLNKGPDHSNMVFNLFRER